jgi:hypothetical protein
MRKIGLLSGIVLCAGVNALSPSIAKADGIGIGVKAGTLGAGVEATVSLVSNLNVRLGANRYTYNFDDTLDDIRYDNELDLNTQSLILDWHPFGGSFRLSAGAFRNRNEFNATATPTANQTIGNNTFTPAQIGTLSGTVSFNPSATYAGIGWGNAVGRNKRLGFTVDLGVLFQDSPEVTLSSSNGGVPQNELRAEEASIEADLEDFETYPVISFGFSFRF